jgi:hypothetical protein
VVRILIIVQIAIGTKSGEILIYDLASSTLIETVKAHSSTVWSLHVRPDEQVLVTGSADKEVKFWEFERTVTSSEEVSAYYVEQASSNHKEMTDATHKITDVESHKNIEDVGRGFVGQIQPEWKAIGSCFTGLHSQDFLSRHPEVLPFSLRSQGKPEGPR